MDINIRMNRATIEALLVGVPLPATKEELLDYAGRQQGGGPAIALLERIPEREYRALQDVGEELEPRQVEERKQPPQTELPEVESDLPPGGPAYVGDAAEPANVVAVRES
jgi:hypothetical protein